MAQCFFVGRPPKGGEALEGAFGVIDRLGLDPYLAQRGNAKHSRV